ncbi:RhuM family protein, partial [Eubacterium aggregans]|uniref:RhuM family protein n=1 Tax=Eubacterium aggregans TaxID=81409 RepID=UPI003F2D00D1
IATVQNEGDRQVERAIEYYNLDVIISVGYRVKSQCGVQFQIWATNILKEYIKKGFAMDDDRLKELGGGGYFKELLERIRDIRASEKVFYTSGVRNLCNKRGLQS